MYRTPRLWLLAPIALFIWIQYSEGGVGGILAFFIVLACAVWAYDNRYFFQDVTTARAKTAQQTALAETPARTTLPTIEDSKMAQAQMHVAWNIIQRAQRDKRINYALSILEEAALPLSKVRQLDPATTIEMKPDKKSDNTITLTHDSITAFMLFQEAAWLREQSEQRNEQVMDAAMAGDQRSFKTLKSEATQLAARAIAAIRKAIAYEPDNIAYLMELTKHMDDCAEKKAIVMHVLSMEPYNVEALEIANRL